MPKPGETIHSKEMFTSGGGKGANQAIAAARNGGNVNFIGAVGNDNSGKALVELLGQDKIETKGIKQLESTRTGSAYVNVNDEGENSIIIYGGANQLITDEHIIEMNNLIEESDYVIAQFETNLSSIEKTFEIAKEMGVTTILNPAPAKRVIPKNIIQLTDILIPNETELETIVGSKITNEAELIKSVHAIHEMGIKIVIVTLGSKGVFYSIYNGDSGFVPALKVKAIDTTAAGDTFIGTFAAKLRSDLSNINDAIAYGNRAASLTVQRYGAQTSIPYKSEINME
ncbi:Ribokinase [Marinilactibacillus psychrotolerans 42ea]|uniref:Deoxyribokinase n=1 Tax=Marinilactibacillus psychrotolerans 42ea TaxID=1255609 RepID=A0A1R4KFJ8_9LACT|nr:Ribokinase [Marinilactibacillus psychrotolerans 42ea]